MTSVRHNGKDPMGMKVKMNLNLDLNQMHYYFVNVATMMKVALMIGHSNDHQLNNHQMKIESMLVMGLNCNQMNTLNSNNLFNSI